MFCHILQFIAGAMIICFENAQAIDVSKLSAIPFAIFEIVFAVAGAITIISASSAKEICSGFQSFGLNSSTKT